MSLLVIGTLQIRNSYCEIVANDNLDFQGLQIAGWHADKARFRGPEHEPRRQRIAVRKICPQSYHVTGVGVDEGLRGY